MTEQHSPFQLSELPNGWAVSWPDYANTVAKNERQIHNLLKILFEDIGVYQAKLGVMLNNDDLETYYIDSVLWYQEDAKQNLAHHIASMYVVAGVRFDDSEEDHAREFLAHLEKRYIWLKLGGGAWA